MIIDSSALLAILLGEEDRQAHLDGKVAAALMDKAEELFFEPPQIHKFTLLAAK